jgi:hypothetical protein
MVTSIMKYRQGGKAYDSRGEAEVKLRLTTSDRKFPGLLRNHGILLARKRA